MDSSSLECIFEILLLMAYDMDVYIIKYTSVLMRNSPERSGN